MKDVKNSKGQWLQRVGTGNSNTYQTRASILWGNLKRRLKALQPRDETYYGSNNLFLNFQDFAQWCQDVPNYVAIDKNGRFYQLDKDILIPGNRDYSHSTCCFVPAELNMIFSKGNNKTNKLLMGTCLEPKSGKFVTHIGGLGLLHGYAGIYETEMEAHRVWQLGKIKVLNNAIQTFHYLPVDVLSGLAAHVDLIRTQYNNYETTS